VVVEVAGEGEVEAEIIGVAAEAAMEETTEERAGVAMEGIVALPMVAARPHMAMAEGTEAVVTAGILVDPGGEGLACNIFNRRFKTAQHFFQLRVSRF
jgi:hypothetical protein